MEEELTCTSCSSTWKRTRLRGRKPLLCPACTSLESTVIKLASPEVKISESEVVPKNTSSESSDLSVSKVHSMMHPRPVNYQDMLESTKKGSKWKCPGCGSILTMLVGISDVPTHRCTPGMVSLKLMERIE